MKTMRNPTLLSRRVMPLLCGLLLFLITDTHGQGENNIWAFGDSLGLDFTSGSPAWIHTSLRAHESPATLCDPAGNLLCYYGNFITVAPAPLIWDRTNSPMPNGAGILGDEAQSGYQGAAIVPFPDGSKQYYLFTQSPIEVYGFTRHTYLYYSVIDMSLRGGLGDVDPLRKNIILDSTTTEKMSIVKGKGCTVWLIVHMHDTSEFHAFKIDIAGLHTSPVRSGFPSLPRASAAGFYMLGAIAGSPDTRLIARVTHADYHLSSIDLFDFDNSTGVLSNQRVLDTITDAGWPQFSPDSRMLYIGYLLMQYNLSLLPSLTAVKASKYEVTPTDSVTTMYMRQGPDNKIYMPVYKSTGVVTDEYLGYLSNPNAAGAACGFSLLSKYPKNTGAAGLGLPVVVPDPTDTFYFHTDTALCFTPDALLSAKSGYDSYVWADRSTGRSKKTDTAGMTWVYMRQGCTLAIDTIRYSRKALDSVHHVYPVSSCFTEPLLLTATAGARGYRWDDGDTGRTKSVTAAGKRWIRYYTGACSITTDTFDVTAATVFDTDIKVHDTSICLLSPATLGGRAGYRVYTWDDGSKSSARPISAAGTYWVRASTDCTIRIDTFHVSAQATDTAFHFKDTIVCFADEMTITAPAGYAHYLWDDGHSGITSTLHADAIKWVFSRNEDCHIRLDSTQVSFIRFSINLPDNDTVCGAATLILDATVTPGNSSYLWADGHTTATDTVNTPGNYTITVSQSGCSLEHTTHITARDFSVDLGNDQTLCSGQELQLNATSPPASYLWQDGSTQASYMVSSSGKYWVTLTQDKCLATDTIIIAVLPCDHCVSIPNTFTPNNDQRNDRFHPLLSCPVLRYECQIRNRYGQEVFGTKDANQGWDGSLNGQQLDAGIYYYWIKISFDYPGAKEQFYKGDISLLR